MQAECTPALRPTPWGALPFAFLAGRMNAARNRMAPVTCTGLAHGYEAACAALLAMP